MNNFLETILGCFLSIVFLICIFFIVGIIGYPFCLLINLIAKKDYEKIVKNKQNFNENIPSKEQLVRDWNYKQ